MEHYSRIKTELLKSGLPLESMIAESINSLSSKLSNPLINHGEYFFQRQESEFPNSVDFLVTHDLDIKNCDFVQIAFLLECKYRTRGTRWYFTPNPLKDSGMEFFVENFFSKGKCNRWTFPSMISPLNDKTMSIVGKGIEIYSNGERNEKSINEAIHQLMFATSSLLPRAFVKEEFMLEIMRKKGIDIKGRSMHSLLCPIIVTTSDLHFLKDVNIEKVEQSKKLEDISKVEKIIVYSAKPPLYVERYIKETVAKDIMASLLFEASTKDVIHYLSEYSAFFPSRYYIVNYKSVIDFLEKYVDFASSMLVYACKESNKSA